MVENALINPQCSCCDIPTVLEIAERNNSLAVCLNTRKFYEKDEDGVFQITPYVRRGRKVIDPRDNRVVYDNDAKSGSKQEEPPSSAEKVTTDSILAELEKDLEEEASTEEAGSQEPSVLGGRVDLENDRHWESGF